MQGQDRRQVEGTQGIAEWSQWELKQQQQQSRERGANALNEKGGDSVDASSTWNGAVDAAG
jgi:hypothetical protein